LSAARLQKFDGRERLHRRPASLGFPSRAISQALAQQKRRGSRRPPSRAGKTGQAQSAPMNTPHLPPNRHSARSRPTFSFPFVPAKRSACAERNLSSVLPFFQFFSVLP